MDFFLNCIYSIWSPSLSKMEYIYMSTSNSYIANWLGLHSASKIIAGISNLFGDHKWYNIAMDTESVFCVYWHLEGDFFTHNILLQVLAGRPKCNNGDKISHIHNTFTKTRGSGNICWEIPLGFLGNGNLEWIGSSCPEYTIYIYPHTKLGYFTINIIRLVVAWQ